MRAHRGLLYSSYFLSTYTVSCLDTVSALQIQHKMTRRYSVDDPQDAHRGGGICGPTRISSKTTLQYRCPWDCVPVTTGGWA